MDAPYLVQNRAILIKKNKILDRPLRKSRNMCNFP